MIRISIVQEKGQINQVTLQGHAEYDHIGKDIVCAAVSATYLCTVNAIFSIASQSIHVVKKEEKQILQIVTHDDIVDKLIMNMMNCLSSLEKQYPKNIKLDKEEK